MLGSLVIFLLAAGPQAAGSPGAPPATPTTKPGTVVLAVVNETGKTLLDAVVRMHGPVDRGGTTGTDGLVTFENVPAGTYRARITHQGSITFEKEVTVRAGVKSNVEAMLTVAPPPPPAPTPTPTPTASAASYWQALKAGEVRVVAVPDLIEPMLKEKPLTVEREIGCSGAVMSRVILARENITPHMHVDVDEVLYVVAGEATIKIDEQDHVLMPGSYVLVPRKMTHGITRRGRTPLVLLSVQSGQPCR
jgi:mannose-6-phosphate isomerase-like protein (cupin superfamily)